MPHSVSAAKRVRQNEKRRLFNRTVRSAIRTAMKKLHTLVDAGKLDEARDAYRATTRKLDKAAARCILHKNTVSRYKSRMALLLNKVSEK